MATNIHHGNNVKRFRQILGVKQEVLAMSLGGDWNQQKISNLESKKMIDDETLQKISSTLKIPFTVLKDFTEEKTYNIISNVFNAEHSNSIASTENVIISNEKSLDKIIELYERMIKEKNDLILELKAKLEN